MELETRRRFAQNDLLSGPERKLLFESTWKHWHPRLRVYLASFAGLSPEDGEELAGDAILKAFQGADGYQPDRPFAPWLFAIARREALSRLRSTARRTERAADPSSLDSTADASRLDPAEEASRAEERETVARLVRDLPERERELAFLVYGQGLRLAEAAEATGAPLGTVKWRMARLRRSLKRALERLYA
jgi:RNA polymerase sigma-70 factor (ECF subfamily)